MLMEKDDIEQLFNSLIEALESYGNCDSILSMIEDARYEFEQQGDIIDSDEV